MCEFRPADGCRGAGARDDMTLVGVDRECRLLHSESIRRQFVEMRLDGVVFTPMLQVYAIRPGVRREKQEDVRTTNRY